MRVKILLVSTFVVLALTGYPASQGRSDAGAAVAGQILVKFRPGASASARADAHRQAGGTRRAAIARTGVELVGVAPGTEAMSIARYGRNPNVLLAEPNFIRRVPEAAADNTSALIVPGDYRFAEQWGLHNTGQMFRCVDAGTCSSAGTPDADIDAPEAWGLLEKGANVRVAVIDTGVDYNHPDLAANYIGGYDFIFDDADPSDDHGHGTHVAGTIAAAVNNPTGNPQEEEGIAGVAPRARILAYKACRADGNCDDFALQQAVARAITDGADIINMSLGETTFSQSLEAAVQDAWNAGLVIVAAAGNHAGQDFFYPAAFDNVISAAAFDENHLRQSFSNYGPWVDISAPGNTIMSTSPMTRCTGPPVPGDVGCYTWMSGTSMAAAHVAGAAALVWSRLDVTGNSQIVEMLLHSADAVGVAVTRLDSWTIHGGLNVGNAMSLPAENRVPIADAGVDQTATDNDGSGAEIVVLDGNASVDVDGSILNYEWREGSTLIAIGSTAHVSLPVGTHTLTLLVSDNLGATDTDSVEISIQPAGTVVDTVVIDKASYTRHGQLTIEATTSAAPDAALTAFDISTGASRSIGLLSYNPRKRKYSGTFSVLTTPAVIEVRSSAMGSDTRVVSKK